MYLPILALFLGSLSIGTTEFVISGILPTLSTQFDVPISKAALLVTGYALGVAIGGPLLTLLTTRFSRKLVALAVLLLFISGHVVCALAMDYSVMMAGRIMSAVGHGCYFGMAVVLASLLAPKDKVGFALAIVFSGVTIANIFGVPLGTAIATAFGWQATFILVALMASAAFFGVLVLVPADGARQGKSASLSNQFRALANRTVLASFALIFLMMVSFWSFSTFLAPFYFEVVGLPPPWLPAALFGGGLVATLGIFIGGKLADTHPTETLRWSFPALVLTCAAAATLAGLSMPLGLAVAMFLVFPVTLVATTVQNRVLVRASSAPDLASTLISSVFNVGIAAGSWLGASAIASGMTYNLLPLIGVLGAAVATIVAHRAAQDDQRKLQKATL
ncbi:MAG: MFS transporter [Alphaproteobacteria bacterium]|nr:MFS transporter [Alphaproteobacteria bacterium]